MKRILALCVVAAAIVGTVAALPAASDTVDGKVVYVKRLSDWPKNSPDPTGITYRKNTNTLLISDAEVDEIPSLYRGSNLFEVTRAGTYLRGRTTAVKTLEPEDIAWDNRSKALWVVDDDANAVFRFTAGPDNRIGTGDDRARKIFGTARYGARDVQGLAFRQSNVSVFMTNSNTAKVIQVRRGPDGKFATPDDVVTSFRTLKFGFALPEDVEFDAVSGHLFIVASTDKAIAVTTLGGNLIRMIDLTGIGIRKPSGIAIAPATDGSGDRHFFVTDRGTDNMLHPSENDGQLFEIKIS